MFKRLYVLGHGKNKILCWDEDRDYWIIIDVFSLLSLSFFVPNISIRIGTMLPRANITLIRSGIRANFGPRVLESLMCYIRTPVDCSERVNDCVHGQMEEFND
jgi:hypothetical protein